MKISRVWAMPNKWTFQIPPIAELLARYVGDGKGWIDPFAGQSSLAELRNDLSPDSCCNSHKDVFDFVGYLEGEWSGCLFDPPYSLDQIVRSYADVGLKSKLGFAKNGALDPTGNWKIVKDKLAYHIKTSGHVISFGWNSNGFGEKRGFEIAEIMLVAHGGGHNDTIVTVEQKVQGHLDPADYDWSLRR